MGVRQGGLVGYARVDGTLAFFCCSSAGPERSEFAFGLQLAVDRCWGRVKKSCWLLDRWVWATRLPERALEARLHKV